MESSAEEGDDVLNMVYGDLGLGEVVRSRHLAELEHHKSASQRGSSVGSKSSLTTSTVPTHDFLHEYLGSQEFIPSALNSLSDSIIYSSGLSLASTGVAPSDRLGALTAVKPKEEDNEHESFPTYADVAYGTSLRQHKKLFEKEVENLRRQYETHPASDASLVEENSKKKKGSRKKNSSRMSGKEISSKLSEAMAEMEELKLELDACRRRLDAKYQAVAILKEQADSADAELKSTELKAHETSRRLEKEVSKLQFELEWKESSFMDSQQTWAERFDRVCQENSILMAKLESRNEELKKANAHKAALSRERDELLALVDVAERLKYEHGKSKVAEDEYGSFTSTELAVLGACKCRMSNPEPCGCAHAAANLRKEVAKLRDEGDWLHQRWEECNLTVDAYRSAFEEQLSKSRKLSHRLSQIATMSSRSAKARAAIKWLIQVMNDEEDIPPKPRDGERRNTLADMSLQELVTVLTDMISEKNEALAHQKLASQMLADKVERLETKTVEPCNHTGREAIAEAAAGLSRTKEVGVQSPSLVSSKRQQVQVTSASSSADSELHFYDEVFDLGRYSSEKYETNLAAVAKAEDERQENCVSIVDEKEADEEESESWRSALDFSDYHVSSGEDHKGDQSNSLSLTSSKSESESRTDSDLWEDAKEEESAK